MDHNYVPISCSVHDQLLALATLRQECDLSVVDASGCILRLRGRIIDVYSSSGAEYLSISDGTTVRLDQIRSVNGEVVPAPASAPPDDLEW